MLNRLRINLILHGIDNNELKLKVLVESFKTFYVHGNYPKYYSLIHINEVEAVNFAIKFIKQIFLSVERLLIV